MNKNDTQYNKMLQTPVSKLVLSLSIPTVISMLVTNIYNIVDTAFVGTLGTSASGAIGIVFGYMAILQAIGFTFGQGSGSIISRLLGKKDYEEASMVASTGFFTAFLVGIFLSIVCLMNIKPLIFLLGSTTTIYAYAKQYIFYLLLSTPFMITSFVLNNILRYEGKALFAMIGLMIGAFLNILGDVLLIFVFQWGVVGAAVSTAVSQVISFSVLLTPFFRNQTLCKISFSKIRMKLSLVLNIFFTGLPSMLRQGLNSLSTVLLNSFAGAYGDAAISAMSNANRVFFFFFSVAVGIGQGFQPVSGFSYGAQKYDRLRSAYKFTVILSECIIFVLGCLMFVFAPFCIQVLRNDPQVITIGARALRLQCIASVFLPFCMITEMLLQSTGKKLAASTLSAFRGGLFFIPILCLLSYIRGLEGIQEAQPIAHALSVIPALVYAPIFFKNLKHNEEIKE